MYRKKNKKSKLSAEAITFNLKKRIYGKSKYYQLPNQTLPFSCFCTVYLVYQTTFFRPIKCRRTVVISRTLIRGG